MPSPQSQSPVPRASRHRPWWQKLGLGIAIAGLLFVVLEIACAMLGVPPLLVEQDPFVGFEASLPLYEVRGEPGHAPQWRTARNKLEFFNDQRFEISKDRNTIRIFCLGGSTTYGRPYEDGTSYVGWLRELLQAAQPSLDWEVINAGGISYASYRLVSLMEELVAHQPDLFVVYTGHNEFLEARTYGPLRQASPTWRWLTLAAARSRTFAVAHRTWHPQPPAQILPDDVETLLDRAVGIDAYHRDPAQRRRVVQHFEQSLVRMVALARDANTPLLLIRPACNLRNCSPFKSEPTADLSAAAREEWTRHFAAGLAALRAGQHAEAVTALGAAAAIDAAPAELHYRLGQSRFASGQFELAEASLRRAVAEDVCPLRMPPDLGQAWDRVVARHEVPTIDFAQRLRAECRRRTGHAVLGDESFLDHVHPTIDSHRLLALALVEQLGGVGRLPLELQCSSSELADVDRRVRGRCGPQAKLQATANLARVLYWSGKVEEAGPLAITALAELPEEPSLLLIAGVYASQQGHDDQALSYLERAQRLSPHDDRIRQAIGLLQRSQP